MTSARGIVAPAIVAQRLCDLLLQFPAAALGGVQWRMLTRKYEERFSTQIKIESMGHSSPISAATALLWDVLRVVDSSDPQNPMLGVEDAVVLTPRPGCIGSWPSLYRALCTAVEKNCANETQMTPGMADGSQTVVRSMLLSQLKPLLQTTWHVSFDENGLGFLNEDGSYTKMKKMKHLVQWVLRWREQRIKWRQCHGGKFTAVDELMSQKLELVASTRHNDFILRYEVHEEATNTARSWRSVSEPSCGQYTPLETQSSTKDAPECLSEHCDTKQELDKLRTENLLLRAQNKQLRLDQEEDDENVQRCAFAHSMQNPHFAPERVAEIFDDPYEPPPQKDDLWNPSSPNRLRISKLGEGSFGFQHASCETPASTSFASGFDIYSDSATCESMTPISNFDAHSGSMTPSLETGNAVATASLGEQVCAFVPMWFSLMPSTLLGDRCVIPTGIVERFRTQFESTSAHTIPPPCTT